MEFTPFWDTWRKNIFSRARNVGIPDFWKSFGGRKRELVVVICLVYLNWIKFTYGLKTAIFGNSCHVVVKSVLNSPKFYWWHCNVFKIRVSLYRKQLSKDTSNSSFVSSKVCSNTVLDLSYGQILRMMTILGCLEIQSTFTTGFNMLSCYNYSRLFIVTNLFKYLRTKCCGCIKLDVRKHSS